MMRILMLQEIQEGRLAYLGNVGYWYLKDKSRVTGIYLGDIYQDYQTKWHYYSAFLSPPKKAVEN